MYDLHRLRLLRELRHRGTLAAVAQALGYNPSTVSHQLGILEREVGTTLLEPAGRRVRLTGAAETLVEHTENILRELEHAEAAISALRTDVAGVVRIATFQTAAHVLLPTALEILADRHPNVRVTFAHLRAEEALPALLARDFDLVLCETYPGDSPAPVPGVTSEPLHTDPLLLAIPAGSPATELAHLADAEWAVEPAGTAARQWALAHCRSAGFEPRVAFESTDVLLHARLVERGLAAAFLPRLIGGDSQARLVPTGQSRTILLARRTGSESAPATSAVREALRTSVPSLVLPGWR